MGGRVLGHSTGSDEAGKGREHEEEALLPLPCRRRAGTGSL